MIKTGTLEVTSEMRAVPLGQKRKRGRPKKMPHCLARSPGPSTAPDADIEEEVPDDVRSAVLTASDANEEVEEDVVDVEVRVTTRKRKNNTVSASKPPKKKARLPFSNSSTESSKAASTSSSQPAYQKPKPKTCRKKKGSCTHEIVFGKHYDRKEWDVYAKNVKEAKSLSCIDS